MKKTTFRYIISRIKNKPKIKNHHQKTLKETREKRHITQERTQVWMTADFLSETTQAGREEVSLKYREKKTVNLEFYSQQKYLLKNKKRCFQTFEN